MKKMENYFLGLDIGTDSVGYAVTNEEYSLVKHKSELMWGVHLFDGAMTSTERRTFRTARRRLDRKQQRIQHIDDIFALEIGKIDPQFFIRKKESALWRDDAKEPFAIFNDIGFTDKEYYKKYPTIHHLIWELIEDKTPHDIRLVYIAIAWLVAHRGHFLNEVSKENLKDVLDINQVYESLYNSFEDEKPWGDIDVEELGKILKKKIGIGAKYKELCLFLYNEPKANKEITDSFSFSKEGILKLLCGGEYSAEKLFGKEEYHELPSLKMSMKDEDLASVLVSLGDDADLVVKIKAFYDWTVLSDILSEGEYISKAKITVYNQHKADLKLLKYLVKRYIPEKYNDVFKKIDEKLDNYVAYSGNFKSDDNRAGQKKKNKEAFCKYITSLFKNVEVIDEDKEAYEDMNSRLALRTFMPKQVDSDNRVLPYQVYWAELDAILKNASEYLPFLNKEKDGYTAKSKIMSVFEFRIPYFVGPLNRHSDKSWFVRASEGRIYPWNFSEKIDFEASEQAFIDKLTNRCTYLPSCNVVPKCSLIYQKFTLLNEINCISVQGKRISVCLKQKIYTELFLKKKKVSIKDIKDLLLSEGIYNKEDLENISGMDLNIKPSLSSHIAFRNLLNSGQLSEEDVEEIIKRSTYSESKARFSLWLEKHYSHLSKEDKKYICSLKFKDFGRLSKELLCDLQGCNKETGEIHSIIGLMWETNQNLNEILFSNYSFREEIEELQKEYYDANPKTLSERLDEMYVPNGVKRSIIRSMDIVSDVVKVCGKSPQKIFIEMSRGDIEDRKAPKTSRLKQLEELYSKIKNEDVKELWESLKAMGDDANNKLQSEWLYLYYLQLGRCMYTFNPIELSQASRELYNIDHIYPRSKVKDDSVLNNKVLVLSTVNASKRNGVIDTEIRSKMKDFWKMLLDNGLITEEKYKRLTRVTPFTEDEEWGFINRQLVETRQATKAIATLLKEKYPESEIVYVKAGLVSDFRNEFKLHKSRCVNDLHHAKDAYLNIVAGNVYNECFTKKWFLENRDNYSIKTGVLFGKKQVRNGNVVWNGNVSLDKVKNIVMNKNSVHFTKYAFCRYGGFFDQMPVKAATSDLVPRKEGLPTEKYGGYNKKSASFFAVVKFKVCKKSDIWLMPVDLLIADKFLKDEEFAKNYAFRELSKVQSKKVEEVSFPLGMRALKINTMLEFDSTKMCLSGKSSGGSKIILSMMKPLLIGHEWETYVKRLERFWEKQKENPRLKFVEEFDKISKENNLRLYDILTEKLDAKAYKKRPANPAEALRKGREKFVLAEINEQVSCLLQIVEVFGRKSGGCDLYLIGAGKTAASNTLSAFVSNWKKAYSSVRIIDASASGLYECKSENLLNLL